MRSSDPPPGRLVILVGLPGAGKTALATWLASEHGFSIASRDAIRAAMFPRCLFSPEEKAAAYEATKVAISTMLRLGLDVVTDGMPFSFAAQIEEVRHLGVTIGAQVKILHCAVPVQIAQRRVELDRVSDPTVPADRDAALVESVAARFGALPTDAITIDAASTLADVRCAIAAALDLKSVR